MHGYDVELMNMNEILSTGTLSCGGIMGEVVVVMTAFMYYE
jgi:hypothetical protein